MNPGPGFAALGVDAQRCRLLTAQAIVRPTSIQQATLPDALGGRDVIGQAPTGAGKTLAFALSLVQRLARDGGPRGAAPRGLVLAPTRELAQQLAMVLAPYASDASLRHRTLVGGNDPREQIAALVAGVDMVIGTPGRVSDLVVRGSLRLDEVAVVVLDEVDQLVEASFLPVVQSILDRAPATAQHLWFSATVDTAVHTLASRYQRDPRLHVVADSEPRSRVDEHVWRVPHWQRRAVVALLARGNERRIFFVRTRHGVRRLSDILTKLGIENVELHGDLTTSARDANLDRFRSGECLVLVATDVAARGLDIDAVPLVVHVDPPADATMYLHRSGRTARADAHGVVVTLCMPAQSHALARLVEAGVIGVTPLDISPDDPVIDEVLDAVRNIAVGQTR